MCSALPTAKAMYLKHQRADMPRLKHCETAQLRFSYNTESCPGCHNSSGFICLQ